RFARRHRPHPHGLRPRDPDRRHHRPAALERPVFKALIPACAPRRAHEPHPRTTMPRFRPEPIYRHDSTPRTGVLLVNLGTPAAPTAAALRPYLKQFLSDPRVVEIPRLVWWPILNGIILNTRPKASAQKYASIWTDEGSPLLVHTVRQTKLLARYLAKDGHDGLDVDYAMRYGAPSIGDTLDAMRAR